jgi:hypothetical protein
LLIGGEGALGTGFGVDLGVCDGFFVKKLEMVGCVAFCDEFGCVD